MKRYLLAATLALCTLSARGGQAQRTPPAPPTPAADGRVTIALSEPWDVTKILALILAQARKPYALAETLKLTSGYYETGILTYPTDAFPRDLILRNIGGLRFSREGKQWVIRPREAGKPIRIAAEPNDTALAAMLAKEFPRATFRYIRRAKLRPIAFNVKNVPFEEAMRKAIEMSGAPLTWTVDNGVYIIRWR